MNVTRRALLGAALGSLATVAGCTRPVDPGTGGGGPGSTFTVGVIGSSTGDDRRAVADSNRFAQGLRAGLLWVTDRTNEVGVRPIVPVPVDDGGDPAAAAAAAEGLIDQGCQIVLGGFSDATALRLAEVAARRKTIFIAATATTDALSGINRYTFRSGMEITQLLQAAKAYVRPGGHLVVLAADRARATKAATMLGAARTIVLPPGTKDFAALERIPAGQIFVDWPVSAPRLWRAIPAAVEPITILGPRSSWSQYGARGAAMKFVTPYVDGISRNAAYEALRGGASRRRTDTGHVEGFVAAQMTVRALQFSVPGVDSMIGSLEGRQLSGVKGRMTVRAQDHLLEQVAWGVRLTWVGAAGVVTAVRDRTFPANALTPPVS